jgi:hypothetical protein
MFDDLLELYIAYLKSDLFKLDANHDSSSQYAGIRHVDTFKTVAQFLVDLAEKEIKFGAKDAFTTWKNRAGAFKAQFLGEFKAYARHQYPFNLPVDEKKGVLKWWQALLGSDSAVILPVCLLFINLQPPQTHKHIQHLAIKIYSVRVNSMPEERTVSTFTWLTPALCSRLSVPAMTAMTQIRQYYKTEEKVFSVILEGL